MSVMSFKAVLLAANRSLKAWYLVLKTARISSREGGATGSPLEKMPFNLWNSWPYAVWINLSPDSLFPRAFRTGRTRDPGLGPRLPTQETHSGRPETPADKTAITLLDQGGTLLKPRGEPGTILDSTHNTLNPFPAAEFFRVVLADYFGHHGLQLIGVAFLFQEGCGLGHR